MNGEEWRAEVKRTQSANAAQRRRQPWRPRKRGVVAITQPGMVRLPPPRDVPAVRRGSTGRHDMTETETRAVAANIDTAYFRGVEPFNGQEDDPKSDIAATTIWVDRCSIGGGLDVTLTIDRTNIRLDMSAQDALRMARLLVRYGLPAERDQRMDAIVEFTGELV